jgi:hypothetical protein
MDGAVHPPLPWSGPAITACHRQGRPQLIDAVQAMDIKG